MIRDRATVTAISDLANELTSFYAIIALDAAYCLWF